MGSSRLPGKVLAEVNGMPLLAFLLRRIARSRADEVIVATSRGAPDDAVADVAERSGVAVVRGSEQDVLGRFVDALELHPAEHVVRITADCPFSDPVLIDRALEAHLAAEADYTSNTLVRTFPDGLDVEVVRSTALQAAGAEATDAVEREHVTPFVYRRPERFRLAAVRHSEFLGDLRWTVDTQDDLRTVQEVARTLTSGLEGWEEILAVVGAGDVSVDPALVPAEASQPGRRQWTYVRGGRPSGTVTLEVEAGMARASLDGVADAERDEVRRLLSQRLDADRQVTHLQFDEGDLREA